jgi:hypothetical protein
MGAAQRKKLLRLDDAGRFSAAYQTETNRNFSQSVLKKINPATCCAILVHLCNEIINTNRAI